MGSIDIQVGDGQATTITVDASNNTLQGLVDTINNSEAGVTASIIKTNEDVDKPYRLLITSKTSGEQGKIAVSGFLSFPPAEGEADPEGELLEIQGGQDAKVGFGTGAEKISYVSATNQIDGLIPGVTLDLKKAAVGETVTLTVAQDVEAAKQTIQGFVTAYNDLIGYVNEQTQFIAETGTAGTLLGDRTVSAIKDDVQFALTSVVAGANTNLNRVSTVGISFNSNGTISLDSTKLEDALTGRIEGVEPNDVLRLFSLSGESSRSGVRYLGGSSRTKTGDFQVEVTSAATQAVSLATNTLGASTVIDATNDEFKFSLDNKESTTLKLAHDTYTPEGLAAELEKVINGDTKLVGRAVSVTVQGGAIQIRSQSYGTSSEIKALGGTALSALGFDGSETSKGQNIVGHFLVNGQREEAAGSGQLLTGKSDNKNTADLQVRVALSSTQLDTENPEATISVTRGIASHLDGVIGKLLELPANGSGGGKIQTANSRYDDLVADIEESIARMNARFDAEQESLIKQFTALETAVSGFQNTASFLSSQLASLGGLGI